MKDHQLWIDTLNLNIQAGKTLQEALLCADALSAREFWLKVAVACLTNRHTVFF